MNERCLQAIWLTAVFGYGSKTAYDLIGAFGGIRELVEQGKTELHFGEYADKVRAAFSQMDFSYPESVLKRCEKEGAQVICLEDPAYPALLKEIPAPPLVLYCMGNLDLLEKPAVTVVGTRKPDDEGKKLACIYTQQLQSAGLQIVSGFAEGIETEIHRKNKGTISVLPSELKRVYPAKNWRLRDEILSKGGLLLTEFEYGVRGFKGSFYLRNRILAGLSMGTLVIQAGDRSGTSITAGDAAQYGRGVYVVPGSTLSRLYTGSYELIQNGATMVLSPLEICLDYQKMMPDYTFSLPEEEKDAQREVHIDLEKGSFTNEQKKILTYLAKGPMYIDELVQRTGLAVNRISSELSMLEIQGIVQKTSQNKYEIKQQQ